MSSVSRGFTLLELLAAIVVVSLGLLGLLAVDSQVRKANEATYERMVAVQDAQRVLELMRNASASGNFPANVARSYPNGGAVSGFNNLTGEQVTVTYADAAADPLDITVTANWREHGLRNASTQLRTMMTQRE